MRSAIFFEYLFVFLIGLSTLTGITQNNKTSVPFDLSIQKPIKTEEQIGQYLISIFEDSKGNMWFGTLEKGVAKYDGNSLKYYNTEDGLIGNGVSSMTEDIDGNIWFGTHSGLSKYDGNSFTNYTTDDGLCHLRISNLLIDTKGRFWIATWGGICLFNGEEFVDFPLQNPSINSMINENTKHWITDIMEDSKGNIWISRDAYGVCKYDGESFQHFTKGLGLPSNNVQCIEEANDGSIWFGTRVAEKDLKDEYRQFGEGGLVSLQDEKMIHYSSQPGLSQSDVYDIYQDSSGELWISTTSHGVYQFDGKRFKNHPVKLGADSKAIMEIFEDSHGSIWLGCAGALFRIDKHEAIPITQKGPWDK